MYGWMDRVLIADLTDLRYETEKLPSTHKDLLGGKGIGAHYLYKYSRKGDPFSSPETPIIIATGPLTGLAPTASRFTAVTKSPLTGGYIDSSCGGFLAQEIKRSGFDAVVITGRASKPTYLWVHDGECEFKPADHLWGLETFESTSRMQQETDEKARVTVIGPAGENLVRFSVLITDTWHAAGRGGLGATFGSKNLKGVSSKGTMEIPFKNPEFRDKASEVAKKGYENPADPIEFGTTWAVVGANDMGMLPVHNFQTTYHELAENLSGQELKKYRIREETCFYCPLRCIKVNEIAGEETCLQYEGMAMLGSNVGIWDMEELGKSYLLCDKLGLDVISAGSVLGFASEALEKGQITKEEMGAPLGFGDGESQREMLRRIAVRDGIGDVLGDGIDVAATRFDAQKLAIHVKGLEMAAWDPRGLLGFGLSYATAEVGASHMRGWPDTESKPDKSALDVIESMVENRDKKIIQDSLVLCSNMLLDWEDLSGMLTLATGVPYKPEDLKKIAWRIDTLTRMINTREGMTRADDALPYRLMHESVPTGPSKGYKAFISQEDFENSLDRYYELRGWTREGTPTKETIQKLGLNT